MSADRVRLEVELPSAPGRALALVSLDSIGVAYGRTGMVVHHNQMSGEQLRALSRAAEELADWLDGSPQ